MATLRSFLGNFFCLVLFLGLCGISCIAGASTSVQLTVKSAGSGAGTVTTSPSGVSCGSTCAAKFTAGTSVKLTAAAKSGSKFAAWSGGCSGTSTTCTISLKAATSVTATFNTSASPIQLTVKSAGSGAGTVTSSPSGVSCGSTCAAKFTPGTSIKLTATAKSGSKFAGWSGSCSGTSATCTVSLKAATTVTATFNTTASPIQLTVTNAGSGAGTVTSSPSGVSCGSTCAAKFTPGTSIKLTAAAKSGSNFAAWSGGCSGTSTTCTISLKAATSVTATFNTIAPIQLTVNSVGTGAGAVTSTPAGIDCPGSCTANFPKGTAVVLTPTPEAGNTFAGWSGLCTGTGTCKLTLQASSTVTPTFEVGTANLTSLKHIIFFAQENRSLDNYFGAMRQYWKANKIPDQSFDGLPQFNPTSGLAPLYGPPPAIPGCNPADPPPSGCVWDPSHTVASFHMISVCNENTSPSWNEAHVDWDYSDQVGKSPAKNNGFVHTAAGDARTNPGTPLFDSDGIRAMGYWNGTDLNYDYFMATNFATSDRFFQPALSRTNINREYLAAATSGGYAYPNGSDAQDTPQLKSKVIFDELQAAGISWKVYINPEGTGCAAPYKPSCLIQTGYLENFTYAQIILAKFPQNVAPISEYFSDLANGTLPQVAEIEPPSDAGLDEHGSDSDLSPENVQEGARYTSTLINALMDSSSWNDSAFIFTFDESGGLYDHVAPQPTVSPDGIPPIDLPPGSVCSTVKGPTCDFVYTGYRIPLTVISPFAKKNYVSHTVADSTAILKLIETRFNLPALTKRDAAQMDMTEFFDFNNPPWMSPPTPPNQNLSNPCYLDKLP
jgi:phospholipase C